MQCVSTNIIIPTREALVGGCAFIDDVLCPEAQPSEVSYLAFFKFGFIHSFGFIHLRVHISTSDRTHAQTEPDRPQQKHTHETLYT